MPTKLSAQGGSYELFLFLRPYQVGKGFRGLTTAVQAQDPLRGLGSKQMTMPPESLSWDTEHLQLAVTAAGVALWSWNVDTDKFRMDDRAFDLWGLSRSKQVTFEDLFWPLTH